MIADLKPYASYKESRLPWLQAVPALWDMVPNRAVMTDQREIVGETAGTRTLLSLTLRGVIARDMVNPKGKFPARFNSYKVVKLDDLVFCLFDIDETPRGVGHSKLNGMITGAYDVFSPRGGVDPRFLYYYYLFIDEGKRLKPFYTGLRKTVQRGVFASLKVPLPPEADQAAIVRFLDWANSRLDRSIGSKRKVIALLNEQKQAVVHRAVTRGLDPAVPLKPSGIPCLGDIPKHWAVQRLRTLVRRIDQGVSPLAVGFLAEGDSWGVLKSGCVNRGVFRETEHKQLARSFEIDPAIVVKVGDVLISRACGSPTLVGSVGRVKSLHYQLILSDKTFRACFSDRVDVDFMVFAMNCRYYRHQVEQAISGAEGMANNLPLSSLRDFSFAIPPADEAAAIAGYLESETAGLQITTARLEREIELLREYRTRLVADVVTGKLDVREAAERLADEPVLHGTETDVDEPDIDSEEADEAEGV